MYFLQSLYVFGRCTRNHVRANDLHHFDLDTNTWHNLGASSLLRGCGGPNSLPLCGGKKIAVITGFAREETVDDNRLDSESQSDKCGYNEMHID